MAQDQAPEDNHDTPHTAQSEQAAPSAAENQGEAGFETDSETLEARIEELEQQLAEARDQTLRAAAEAQNARHRAEKDVESARKYGLDRFASDMLPVADNLERALDTADTSADGVKALIEGVELTRRTLLDALGRHNVEQLDPTGEPFDPQFHEAMTMIENPATEPNTVLEVMQKGYTLNGRLIRAAMVVVSRGAAGKVDETV